MVTLHPLAQTALFTLIKTALLIVVLVNNLLILLNKLQVFFTSKHVSLSRKGYFEFKSVDLVKQAFRRTFKKAPPHENNIGVSSL